MARPLRSKTNIIPPDSDYTFGRLKDDDGSKNGTPVDEKLLGDGSQFFEKLMFDAGIAMNGLPENAYSGFQYNQALISLINGAKSWNNFALLNSWSIAGGGVGRWRFLGYGSSTIEIQATLKTPAGLSQTFANIPSEWNAPVAGIDLNYPITTLRGASYLNNFVFSIVSGSSLLKILPANADSMTSNDINYINGIFRIDH